MLRIKIGKFALVWRPSERPRSGRRLVLTFALLATLVYAGVPHTFKDGDTLTASQLNENFQALSAKLDAMEGKSWRLIYETDVSTATASIDVTGMNGDSDKEYRIVSLIVNGSGASATYSIAINNDTTAGNYGWQRVTGTAGAASANRNTAETGVAVGFATAATTSFSTIDLFAKSGTSRHYIGHQLESVNGSTADSSTVKHGIWTNTATNITSLNFKSTQVNGIGAGSHIEIWARR